MPAAPDQQVPWHWSATNGYWFYCCGVKLLLSPTMGYTIQRTQDIIICYNIILHYDERNLSQRTPLKSEPSLKKRECPVFIIFIVFF